MGLALKYRFPMVCVVFVAILALVLWIGWKVGTKNLIDLALAAVVAEATLAALFQDRLRSWVWTPILRVWMDPSSTDCRMTRAYTPVTSYRLNAPIPAINANAGDLVTVHSQAATPGLPEVYYYRLRVINDGNHVARDVEAYIKRVEEKVGTGWREVDRPVQHWLRWPVLRNLNPAVLHFPLIPPKATRYCDFALIRDPSSSVGPLQQLPGAAPGTTALELDVEPKYLHLGHLFGPGTYRFTLEVAAANHPPHPHWFVFTHSGRWDRNPAVMLTSLSYINNVQPGRPQEST